MRIRNLTPFPFGAVVTSTSPPQPQMACILRGRFSIRRGERACVLPAPNGIDALTQGPLSAERFRDEDRNLDCVYPGDFAPLKLSAEVLVSASCHTPDARPLPECPVHVALGSWSKSLRVVGRRRWETGMLGARLSAPEPFTALPLDATASFGGAGFAANPVGKGHGTDELPNVEYPREPLLQRGDRIRPAGFGPLHPDWPPRAAKVGKEYGKTYQETRAPFVAVDFDWTHYQAAPDDQQLPGALRGDERFVFQNLHPTVPVLEGTLPGVRIRVFAQGVDRRFREVAMRLDTVYAEPGEELLTLTWRGLDDVAEDDLSDVEFMLVAQEQLDEAKLPTEHYRQLLAELEADPTGFKAAQAEALAEMSAGLDQDIAGAFPAPSALPPGADPMSALLAKAAGGQAVPGGGGLAKLLQQVFAKASPETRKAIEEAARAVEGAAKPPVTPGGAGPKPRAAVQDILRGLFAVAGEAKEKALKAGVPAKELAPLDALRDDPRLKALDPTVGADGPAGKDEPGPYRNLSGQDLSGRDLAGVDLRGANLEGTILQGANLEGANLADANLRCAVLADAVLVNARLDGAELEHANFTRAKARGVSLVGAHADWTVWSGADLCEAKLGELRGKFLSFARAKLCGATARGAELAEADFEEADLGGADFELARLDRCLWLRSNARGVSLVGANVEGSSFAEADLGEAKLERLAGRNTIWLKTKLVRADLSLAVLVGAKMHECEAQHVRFYGANLRDAVLYRARLDHSTFEKANLFGADLRKCRVADVSFRDASLYDAKLLGAKGAGCDFTGANLKRSTLERA